jgi:hypothetical protein
MDRFRDIANTNPTLRVLIRPASLRFLLEMGENAYLITIDDGEIKPIQDAQSLLFDANWQFAIRAPLSSWDKNTAQVPPPEFTDFIFMSFNGHLTLEGNLLPLWQHIRAIHWMFDLMREVEPSTAAA